MLPISQDLLFNMAVEIRLETLFNDFKKCRLKLLQAKHTEVVWDLVGNFQLFHLGPL